MATLTMLLPCVELACGVIVGRALLEGKFTVKEAIACWAKRIIPCLDVRDGQGG
ncbi:hypothetical protein O5478_18370 [Escherichia coli]|nr:hypothetical protein [Escherichia coli]